MASVEYLEGAVVGGVEKVPETLRPYYEEIEIDGGKVAIPRVKPVEVSGRYYSLEDVKGLKQTNLDLKEEKRKLSEARGDVDAKIKKLEDEKTAAEQRAELLAKQRVAEGGDAVKAREELDAQLKKIEDEAKVKLKKLEEDHGKQVAELEDTIHNITSVTAVDVALAAAKIKPEYETLIKGEMLKVTKTHRMDGKPVPVVIDPKTKEPRTSPKPSSMDLMTPAELAQEMRKLYPSCFQQDESASGAGSPPTHRPVSQEAIDSTVPVQQWSNDRKLAFIEKNGQEAYEKLVMANYKSPFQQG